MKERILRFLTAGGSGMEEFLDTKEAPDADREAVKEHEKELEAALMRGRRAKAVVRAEQKGFYRIYRLVAVASCIAMAAVLLGADEALGIDIDDEAVRVSNENIIKNGLEGRISIRHGNLMDGVDYEPDIIVANLMADLVVMLSPAAAAQLKPGGVHITSGILDIKEEIVKKAIEEAGFDIIEVLKDGEWRAVSAVRR